MAAMTRYDAARWADAAVRGIVSKQEQARARQELLDHMEDHAEALTAAGFSAGEAQQQAVLAMGDPEVTARLLRKAHQPLLTRLVQAARVVTICLAVAAALALLVSFVKKDNLLPHWFQGTPYPQLQEAYFAQPADDSVLLRRVCQPGASLPVGDYTLRVHKVALDQRENRWEVNMLIEMDGKYLWQDPPVLPEGSRFFVDGQAFDFGHVAFWGHRQGGSFYSWFSLELPEEPDGLTLELPCEGRTYVLRIDLKGGDVYEKAR